MANQTSRYESARPETRAACAKHAATELVTFGGVALASLTADRIVGEAGRLYPGFAATAEEAAAAKAWAADRYRRG